MKLVSKITLLLAGVTVAVVGINYAILNATVSSSFAELERDSAAQNTDRVRQAIAREAELLESTTADWSFWTDTHEYALGNNPDYVDENLRASTLAGLDVNSLYILDLKGDVLSGMSIDLDSEEEISIDRLSKDESSRMQPLLHGADATGDSLFSGLIMTEKGLMAVASSPILNNDREGPSAGTLVFGKLIDESVVEELVAQTSVKFELLAPTAAELPANVKAGNGPVVHQQSDAMLAAFHVLSDVTGNPISVIKSQTPRDITKNGWETLKLALGLLIAAGIAGILTMAVGLRKIALNPLSHLAETVLKVSRTGDLKIRSGMKRNDEIGLLAKQFDEMLDELVVARETMREQSYYTGILEMSAGLLHNLRNSLNPVKMGIWSALEILRQNRLENFNRAIKELSELDVDADRRAKLFEYVGEAASAMSEERENLIERIQTIGSETDAIAKILDQQNKLNRPDLCIENVDLRDVFMSAAKQIPDGRGIVLDVVCDEDEPMVMGNQILLSQIVGNILLNAIEAIEATGRGHGTIKVLASIDRDASAPMATVTIKDDGDGVPPDSLPKVFERGYTTRKAESGGLGLHWCANTVIAMGGKISLDSAGVGEGATVQIDLKSAVNQEQEEAA